MDTEQTQQQWETGWADESHTTEWGYVDTAAHTTQNTEHRSGARRANTQTDGQLTADGAAVSCRCRGWGGRGGATPQPWSVLSLQGRRTPHFFFSHLTSHFRIVGFHNDRGTMETRLKMQITGLSGIFGVLSCPSVTEPDMCGNTNGSWRPQRLVAHRQLTRHWMEPFTVHHKTLPLELKHRTLLRAQNILETPSHSNVTP